MIIGLECSKFNLRSNNESASFSYLDSLLMDKVPLSTLPNFSHKLDTQDFCFVGNYLVVAHHKASVFRDFPVGNVEMYHLKRSEDLSEAVEPIKLPNDQFLNFPTCLTCYDNWLLVGIAGQNYHSGIFIYDLSNPSSPVLNQYVELSRSKVRNPYGLYFDGETLLVSYFSDNSVDFFKIWLAKKTYTYISSLALPMMSNPLALTSHKGSFLCVAHESNNLISMEIEGDEMLFEEVDIPSGAFNGPWGICSKGEKIYVSNLGLRDKSLPSILSMTKISANKYVIDAEFISDGVGFTVLRDMDLNYFARFFQDEASVSLAGGRRLLQ